MSFPGLKPHQFSNPLVNVVERDLRPIRGLLQSNAAELAQYKKKAKKEGKPSLPASVWALMAVHAFWRGLKGGKLGCGVQAPARSGGGWAALLGCSQRNVGYAFARAGREGLIYRHPREIAHRWNDGKRQLEHADIHSVSFLTPKGLELLESVKGKGRICRLVVRQGHNRRVLVAHGLMGHLLVQLRGKIELISLRLSALKIRFRPTAIKPNEKKKQTTVRGSPVGNASVQTVSPRHGLPKVTGTGPPAAGMGMVDSRHLRLFRRAQLTPANAWPGCWKPLKKFEGRTRHHWWLIAQFKKLMSQICWAEEPSTRQLELAAQWTQTFPRKNGWASAETKAFLSLGGRG